MNVEALNCPNCGAGVASDRTQCEFCKSCLKTMACPSCMGVMFVGTQFCGHCGEKMVQADAGEGDGPGECPRCHVALNSLIIGTVAFRECGKCSGMWADVETFEHLCATREEQSAVLGYAGTRERSFEPLATVSYVPCPDCRQLMNRSNFARASGVIIDICKKHGVWFDVDELPKVIEFIQKGGMEIAREKERIEIRSEADRLRDAQNRQARMDQRYGAGNIFEHDFEHDDEGISGFLRKLFR